MHQARQLSLFGGPRQRGKKPPPPLEFATHCVLAGIIKVALAPGWRATHLPFGEHRNKVTAIRLKRMGTRPGWPDWLFLGPCRDLFFLELKRRGSGRLSDEQEIIHEHIMRCGFDVQVARDVETAVAMLKARGILRGGVR